MNLPRLNDDAVTALDSVRASVHPVEGLLARALGSRNVATALDVTGLLGSLEAGALEVESAATTRKTPRRQLDAVVMQARRNAAVHGRHEADVADLIVGIAASATLAGVFLRLVGLTAESLNQILRLESRTTPESNASREMPPVRAKPSGIAGGGDIETYLIVESAPLRGVKGIGKTVQLGHSGSVEFTLLELRTAGGLLFWRATHPTRSVGVPTLRVTDNAGTKYRTAPAWLEGVDWARRGASAFAPGPMTPEITVELDFVSRGESTGPLAIDVSSAS